ncbi:MAG: class I SAM-dependent methyltransferase [Fidelibacterota bacterium]|nr:MAG: class I SAM-dependent methyltransferase [Candidatus Neomarinimicrobiota bacterium]
MMIIEVSAMDPEAILARKKQLESQYGPWSTPVYLGQGIVTSDEPDKSMGTRTRKIVQIVKDIARRPLEELRILDLASLEGQYSLEFADRGAQVVGIEGREANVIKARFAQEVLELDNVIFHADDVRNLSVEKYGTFDIVLCLGIHYHLDVPDVFTFLEQVAAVCLDFAVIDTHINLETAEEVEYQGLRYQGRHVLEHRAGTSPERRQANIWASLDNPHSFWFNLNSLLQLASQVGFSSIYECHIPIWQNMTKDRIVLLAMKGEREFGFSFREKKELLDPGP